MLLSRRFSVLTVAAILCLISQAAGQRIDPVFAPVLQSFGTTTNRPVVKTSALQPDGKLLVGGQFTVAGDLARSAIARFNPDGTPDVTFNAGDIAVGEQLLTTMTGGTVDVIKVQSDGQIMIGGNYRREVDAAAHSIERLNPDGTVDPTFNVPINIFGVNDIEIQPDGKYVIGGSFELTVSDPTTGQSLQIRYLARLNHDGSLDLSFRPSAKLNSNNIVIQPDGKIVVGDAATNTSTSELRRFNSDGSLDGVITSFDDWVLGLELLPDGKFMVVGRFAYVNDQFQRFIARLNPDGSRDAGFASDVGLTNGTAFADLDIQPDGKVVVGGDFSNLGSRTLWRVARFDPDGSLDPSFNSSTPIAGVVTEVQTLPNGSIFIGGALPLPPANEFYANMGILTPNGPLDLVRTRAYVVLGGEGETILQQPDGKVVIGGYVYYANNVRRRGIVRYNADGTLDSGFVPYQNLAEVRDMVLQPDGKLIVVNSDSPSGLFRLNPDGSLDTSFTSPFVSFSASIQKRTRIGQIALQPDGKLIVGGQLITGSATSPTLSGLARLNPNGSRDTTFALVGALGGVVNVYDLALQSDGKIVIGGDFSRINNDGSYAYLARVDTNGQPDPTFRPPPPPSAIGVVYELEIQPDGGVVYAGNFDHILRVNADGSPDTTFDTPVNDIVKAMAVDGSGRIYVGGYFTVVGGVSRRRIARLLPNGAVDVQFDPNRGANGTVHDIFVQADGGVLIAGSFTKLAQAERIGAGRFYEVGRVRHAPRGRRLSPR